MSGLIWRMRNGSSNGEGAEDTRYKAHGRICARRSRLSTDEIGSTANDPEHADRRGIHVRMLPVRTIQIQLINDSLSVGAGKSDTR